MDPLNFDPYGLGIDPAVFAAFAAQIGQPAAAAPAPAAAPEAPPMPASQTLQAPTAAPLAAAVPANANAYLAANPDVAKFAADAVAAHYAPPGWSGGVIDTPDEAAAYHAWMYGGTEGRDNAAALAATVPTYAMPAPKATNGLQFDDPALMPANDKYATPYYAAYTNDNDFAGAVMAGANQKIRLVDQTNGQVVYEGVGQEGAKKATELANAASQSKGREAAWAIQIDQGGQWVTSAAERYDPEDKGFFGSLMDILLPIAGAILLPGVGGVLGGALGSGLGAAGGSLVSSVAQGRDLDDALELAAFSGIGAGVIGPAVGDFVSGLGGGGVNIIPGSDQLISAAIPDAVTGIAAPGVVPGLTSLGGVAGTAGVSAASSAAAGAVYDNLVSTLIVQGMAPTAAAQTAAQMIATGAGAAVGAGAGLATTPKPATTDADGVTTVDEVVVTAPTAQPTGITPIDLVSAIPAVTGVPAPQPSGPVQQFNDPTADNDLLEPGLAGAVAAAASGNLQAWMDAYGINTDMLGLLLGLGGALGGGGGGQQPTGSGLNIGDANNAAAGTRGSLSDIFRAQLPAATFGAKTPRNVSMPLSGWKSYAIGGPEQSFFSSVPEVASGVSGLSAGLSKIPDEVIGDRNGDGRIDSIDRMLFAASIKG